MFGPVGVFALPESYEHKVKKLRNLTNLPVSMVFWQEDIDTYHRVICVPENPEDPDNTGVEDYVALLPGGRHLDLLGVDFMDFKIIGNIFIERK